MKNLYFTARNGELYTKFTKEEIYSTIDPYNWVTILNWLEEMDYLKGKIAKVIGMTKGNYLLDIGTYEDKDGKYRTCYEFSKEMLEFM